MWDVVDTGSASVCRQCDCRRGVAVRAHVYTGRSHDHKLSCIARRGCVLYDGLRTRRLAAVGTDGDSTNGLVSPLPVACASAIRSHRAHADDKGPSCKHARMRTPSWRQRSAIARACFPLRPRTRSFDLMATRAAWPQLAVARRRHAQDQPRIPGAGAAGLQLHVVVVRCASLPAALALVFASWTPPPRRWVAAVLPRALACGRALAMTHTAAPQVGCLPPSNFGDVLCAPHLRGRPKLEHSQLARLRARFTLHPAVNQSCWESEQAVSTKQNGLGVMQDRASSHAIAWRAMAKSSSEFARRSRRSECAATNWPGHAGVS